MWFHTLTVWIDGDYNWIQNILFEILPLLAIIVKVGSFEEAKKVVDIGVDGIIVQGVEAGGHIIGLVLEYFCSRYLCNLYHYCFQLFILILLEDLKHR